MSDWSNAYGYDPSFFTDRGRVAPQFSQQFGDRLQRGLTDAEAATGGRASLSSGYRTPEEQAALYARYQNGGPLAAPPGRSRHQFGAAADLNAGPVRDWLRANAGNYGLETINNDNPHIQLASADYRGQPATNAAGQSPTDARPNQGAPVADDYDAYLSQAMRQLAQPQGDGGLIPGMDKAARYLMAIGNPGAMGSLDSANKDAEKRNQMMLTLMQHQQGRQDRQQQNQIINDTRQQGLQDRQEQRLWQRYNSSEDAIDPRTGKKRSFDEWRATQPGGGAPAPGGPMPAPGGPMPAPGGAGLPPTPNATLSALSAGGAPGQPPQGLPPTPNATLQAMGQGDDSDMAAASASPVGPALARLQALSQPSYGFTPPGQGSFQPAQGGGGPPQPQAAPGAPAPVPGGPAPGGPAPAPAPAPVQSASGSMGQPDFKLSPLSSVQDYQKWGNQVRDYVKANGGKLTPELMDKIGNAFPDSGMGSYVKQVAQGRLPMAGKDGNFTHQQLNNVVTALSEFDPRVSNAYALRQDADKAFNGEQGKKGTVGQILDSFANLTGSVDDEGKFQPGHLAQFVRHETGIPTVNSVAGMPSLSRVQGPNVGHGFEISHPGATDADWAANQNRQIRGQKEYQEAASASDKAAHNIGAETENIVAAGRSGQAGRFEQAEDLKGEKTPLTKAGAANESLKLVEPRLAEIERNIRNDYALDPDAMKEKLGRVEQLRKGVNKTREMLDRFHDVAGNRAEGHSLAGDLLATPSATLSKLLSGGY